MSEKTFEEIISGSKDLELLKVLYKREKGIEEEKELKAKRLSEEIRSLEEKLKLKQKEFQEMRSFHMCVKRSDVISRRIADISTSNL